MSFPDAFFLWLVSHYQGHEHIVRTNKDEGFSHLEDEDRAVEFVNQYGGENLIIETEYRQYTLYYGDHHAHYDIEYDPDRIGLLRKIDEIFAKSFALIPELQISKETSE